MSRDVVRQFSLFLLLALLVSYRPCRCESPVPASPMTESQKRLERVIARKNATFVICHRGASEFAHENTLEAYRATFELGADGNEIDIRSTKDGVLVCFHDDMLDHLLVSYGDVSEVTWSELQTFPFRNPGQFGKDCRIPTLEEVFALHRHYGGLMHLDIKRPHLDQAIAQLLDRMDLWEHVVSCPKDLGATILKNPRISLRSYKAGLYLDRGEVFPEAIASALSKTGQGLIVDDPRGTIVALGRRLGTVSTRPVSPLVNTPLKSHQETSSESELVAILRDHTDWNQVALSPTEQTASAKRIRTRAEACDKLLMLRTKVPETFAALEERVRNRSLHKDWQYHGLDGALALQTLILLKAPQATELARFALWRDDPALEPAVNPLYKNPRAWTDFRVKMLIFPALATLPGPETEKICRDYLALSDTDARILGPEQFEAAGRTLLAVSPTSETALELLRHRLQSVRGRVILDCLAHPTGEWARTALELGAPHARAYVTPSE